jgi:hypothetical protein
VPGFYFVGADRSNDIDRANQSIEAKSLSTRFARCDDAQVLLSDEIAWKSIGWFDTNA